MRGRHSRICASETEVAEPVIIGDDQDDVGRRARFSRLVPLEIAQLSLLLENACPRGAMLSYRHTVSVEHRAGAQLSTVAGVSWPLSKYSRSSGASAGTS